ncbi:PAQR family membrane homeostasis protein TrhA [Zobellella aerophila]|uniref:PAQR family membrane homeostasis protein TrhA n=1 Tax=Zobellella aerophila TaxID=870480 RepID=UPI0031EA58EB
MRVFLTNPERPQSPAEERANSLSHGIGLLAALVGSPWLILHAALIGDRPFVVGVILFVTTVVLLYLASTLYHLLPPGKAKRVFRVIEHCAIFLLIAGTYTPFSLGVLRGGWGWTLFGIVWGLALVGVAIKVFVKRFRPLFSTALYLLMGWVIVVAIDPLLARMPLEGLLWLLAGGLCYTLGVVFFATDARLRFGHLVWHLFVMAGTACHYLAVFWYAV